MTDVRRLVSLLEQRAGIAFDRGIAATTLERFVRQRSHALGLSTEAYLSNVRDGASGETETLLNAFTVTYTWFFRDAEQLDLLGQLLTQESPRNRRLRVWVPGCSTGEDAYSIAALAAHHGREVQVLGTDINSEVLERARTARYGRWSLRELPSWAQPYFAPVAAGLHEVSRELRDKVTFARHNLVEAPMAPADGTGWDLILCRNVFIYFRPELALSVTERLGRSLVDGGWLLLGASDILQGEPLGLERVQRGSRFVFRRPGLETLAATWSTFSEAPTLPPVVLPDPLALPTSGAAAGGTSGDPTSVQAHVEAGHDAFEAGNLAGALAAYVQAQAADPICTEAHLCAGVTLHLLGDPAGAASALRSALFLEPELRAASFYLALSYESLGRTSDALREYERLLETPAPSLDFASASRVLRHLKAWDTDLLEMARTRLAKSRGGGSARASQERKP